MASSLSIWQEAELREVTLKLGACLGHLDRIISCDAVDDLEDVETLDTERKRLEKALKNLENLL